MPRSVATPVNRLSADERREAVLDAAVHEFAQAGYHAASTTSIARRAGISQPYIYALFPNKKALFIACQERVSQRIREAFEEAAEGVEDSDERVQRMGEAYKRLLDDRDHLLCQLHGFAAAGDPEIREPVAACFMATFDRIGELLGAGPDAAREFVAMGMYFNIARALDLPGAYKGEG